jgi:predicted GNAT family acetyltransferase
MVAPFRADRSALVCKTLRCRLQWPHLDYPSTNVIVARTLAISNHPSLERTSDTPTDCAMKQNSSRTAGNLRTALEAFTNMGTEAFPGRAERAGLIAFVHTQVDERLQGRGPADHLIRFALEDVRARGLAQCCRSVRSSKDSSNVIASSRLWFRHLQGAVRLVRRYEGEHIEVTYDTTQPSRCRTRTRDAGRFRYAKRPWIAPDAAICRCSQSANEPYCDRSGPGREWEYEPGR